MLRGQAVFGRLFAIPGGVRTLGRGLEPVQGALQAFGGGVVTTGGCSITGLDKVGAPAGAEVTVAATPVPIDAKQSPGRARHPRSTPFQPPGHATPQPCPVSWLRRRDDPLRHPTPRPVQDLIERRVPLATAPVVGDAISMIGGTIPGIWCGVPLVGLLIPLVRGVLSLVQPVVPGSRSTGRGSTPPPRHRVASASCRSRPTSWPCCTEPSRDRPRTPTSLAVPVDPAGTSSLDQLGAALHPETLSSRLGALLRRSACVIRLHDARHTCGTLLHLQRVPVAVIAAWLGHADPASTMRTYVHAKEDALRDAAVALHRRRDTDMTSEGEDT